MSTFESIHYPICQRAGNLGHLAGITHIGIDIAFPFEDDIPKPVVLVGKNGSGKSILLSHIVNGLLSAKDLIYPDTPEVETGKVYKLRSTTYISSESEFYFGRVDFEDNLSVTELQSRRLKREYDVLPNELSEPDELDAWNKLRPESKRLL